MAAPHRAGVSMGLRRCIQIRRSGKDKQTPTSGKYKRCSKMTSRTDTMLEVGARVMKNQKMEKDAMGLRLRRYQASSAMESNSNPETMTDGCDKLVDGRTS